eukprot:s1196_g3.t1
MFFCRKVSYDGEKHLQFDVNGELSIARLDQIPGILDTHNFASWLVATKCRNRENGQFPVPRKSGLKFQEEQASFTTAEESGFRGASCVHQK